EFMKQSIFGERIAHGLLGLAIQSGLFSRATRAYATLAFVGLRWKFKAPVKIGDTIRLRAKVIARKDLSEPGRGLVTLERTLLNRSRISAKRPMRDGGLVVEDRALVDQRGEVVQQGKFTFLVAKRPKEAVS